MKYSLFTYFTQQVPKYLRQDHTQLLPQYNTGTEEVLVMLGLPGNVHQGVLHGSHSVCLH